MISPVPRTRARCIFNFNSIKRDCPSQNAQVRNAVEYEGTPADAAAPVACKAVRRSARLTFLPDSGAAGTGGALENGRVY